ncbi:MAG: hypothetical protein IVW55_12690, partial [Chloroflexi bacterium]|nr:hypothetical protein [Chloroflexota bacterium]
MTHVIDQQDGQGQQQQHWRYRYLAIALLVLLASLGLTASVALAGLPAGTTSRGVAVTVATTPPIQQQGTNRSRGIALPQSNSNKAPNVPSDCSIDGAITTSDPTHSTSLDFGAKPSGRTYRPLDIPELVMNATKYMAAHLQVRSFAPKSSLNGLPDPAACGTTNTCPGTFSATPNYDTYSFTNNSSSDQCITVSLPNTLPAGMFSAAYLGSFDPADPCVNYIADSGGSAPATSYSFTVPANAVFVVEVEAWSAGETGTYTLGVIGDVSGPGCATGGTATTTVTGTPPTSTATGTSTSTPTASPTCGVAWRVITSPNNGSGDNIFGSVSVVSVNDIW